MPALLNIARLLGAGGCTVPVVRDGRVDLVWTVPSIFHDEVTERRRVRGGVSDMRRRRPSPSCATVPSMTAV
jgi:hypothetical protein